MTAAELVKRARLDARLSQRALAATAGVPQSTIARIERGTLDPRSSTIEQVLAAAGRTLTSEPLAGSGVDRTQLRELRRLTPGERLRRLTAAGRAFRALREGARARRR